MNPYSWIILTLSLIGFVPGFYFAWTWWRRVPHPFGWAAFDAGGWVVAFLVIYAYTIVGYLIGEFSRPHSWWQAIGRLMLSVVIDALIIARTIRWRRISKPYREAGRQAPPVGH